MSTGRTDLARVVLATFAFEEQHLSRVLGALAVRRGDKVPASAMCVTNANSDVNQGFAGELRSCRNAGHIVPKQN